MGHGARQAHSLERGNRHEVVSAFDTDACRSLAALIVEITVVTEPIEQRVVPPAPGTAPWAPRIIHAPPSRWPVIIPLSLLAGLALCAWLLMDRSFLNVLARLAGAP
jgi:hypothetical protein